GSGWGGFAVYAAERYGCRVTTTTISREQHAFATERVRAAGLQQLGSMLLQAIVIDDRAYEVEKAGRSFINTYIFPGGCLPSLAAISRALTRASDLRPVHLEDITAHYAETLAHWRARFHAA